MKISEEEIKRRVTAAKQAVGVRVRDARKRAGFQNAEDAAEALGISATAQYELERGKNWLKADMAVRVSHHFGVTLASLMPDSELSLAPAKAPAPTTKEALTVIAGALNLRPPSLQVASIGANQTKLIDAIYSGIISEDDARDLLDGLIREGGEMIANHRKAVAAQAIKAGRERNKKA